MSINPVCPYVVGGYNNTCKMAGMFFVSSSFSQHGELKKIHIIIFVVVKKVAWEKKIIITHIPPVPRVPTLLGRKEPVTQNTGVKRRSTRFVFKPLKLSTFPFTCPAASKNHVLVAYIPSAPRVATMIIADHLSDISTFGHSS